MLGLMLISVGCGTSKTTDLDSTDSSKRQVVLRDLKVLVVDDETIGPVIARQWTARSTANLEIVNRSIADLESDDFLVDKEIDVVIYPPRLMGDFVTAKRFEEISDAVWDDKKQLNKKELLRHSRTTNIRWANRTWAVPLGSPQFVMLYRTDVLEQLGESPPETWLDFERIAKKLASANDLNDSNGQPLPTRIGLPLADYWRAQMLLLRSAAYLRARGRVSTVFNRNSGKPMIDNPGYVKALEGLLTIAGTNYDQLSKQDPKQTFQAMLDGQTAIAITWPSATFQSDSESEFTDRISIANIPGSKSIFNPSKGTWSERDSETTQDVPLIGFAGLVASISANSNNIISAQELLKWLPSKPISNSVLAKSVHSGPFRASHLGNPVKWTGGLVTPEAGEEYASVIRAANENTVVIVFPRIPGQSKFIAALDEAVDNAMEGRESASDALKKAAGEFEQILKDTPQKTLGIWLKSSKDF